MEIKLERLLHSQNVKHTAPLTGMYCDILFTDGGLKMVSGAQPRSAVGCSVLLAKLV
ncbi:hypothetical protein [Rubritalea tangerina]|uniref:hypothetical protein n=1 Tax=Rubritalea tangerina TaxID=430798 RepID=UPI00360FE03B